MRVEEGNNQHLIIIVSATPRFQKAEAGCRVNVKVMYKLSIRGFISFYFLIIQHFELETVYAHQAY